MSGYIRGHLKAVNLFWEMNLFDKLIGESIIPLLC